jgi:HPt (histidine-containing phosphotransfer) domain-containing protein
MFLQNGFNDYLAKPIEIPKLNEMIERWVPKEKRLKNERHTHEADSTPKTNLTIEGVNVRLGIAMTGGILDRYVNVLKIYCQDAATRMEVLASAPDEENLALFTTQVHALKSASASIGAVSLSERAARLEDAGRRGDMDAIAKERDGFRKDLSNLTDRILNTLAAFTDAQEPSQPAPPRDCYPLLNELADALKAEQVRSIDLLLEELRQKTLDAQTKKSLERISDAVLMAQFDEALEITNELRNGNKGSKS